MISIKPLASAALLTLTLTAYANDGNVNTTCPSSVANGIDAQFGPGAAANTECLAKRQKIRVVAAWNNNDINSRNGIGQQVVNVNNMVNDYAKYGIEIGEDAKIVAIGYGAGARWLLSDAAYVEKVDPSATNGNPSRATVESLLGQGVRILMCQNTMRGAGYDIADLIPGVGMVPAGVTAVIDYEKRRYSYIAP